MKKVVLAILFVAFSATCFSQQIEPLAAKPRVDYLQESKKQKTWAWMLTGAGTAGLIATLGADASQAIGGGLTTIFSLGTVEPEYKSYTAQYLLSAAVVIGGITLFTAASKNKKRAKALIVFTNMEKMPAIQKNKISSQSFPVAGLKISL